MAHIEEMLINGTMTPVTVFDQPGQAIDDAAVKAKYMPGQNLLINSLWTNPAAIIDQRGGYVVKPNSPIYKGADTTIEPYTSDKYIKVDTYRADGWCSVTIDGDNTYRVWSSYCVRGYVGVGYTIDGWRTNSDKIAILLDAKALRVLSIGAPSGWIYYEAIENGADFAGKTITASFLIDGFLGANIRPIISFRNSSDSEITAVSAIPQNGVVSLTKEDVPAETVFIRVGLYGYAGITAGDYISTKAAALNPGSVQTCFHRDDDGNWVPNWVNDPALELAKSQRYFEKSCDMDVSVGSPAHGGALIKVADSVWGFYEPNVRLKVTKRATPVVKIFSSQTGAEGMAYDQTAGVDAAVVPSYIGENGFTVQHAGENLIVGHAYSFYYTADANL